MTTRGRRIALTAALVAAALVLGRLTVGVLADAWWAATVAPGAAGSLLRLHGIRLGLEAGVILLASAWFVFHLMLVLRLVERVEVPRYLANLEFRETIRPGTLRLLAVALGVACGVLTGLGAGEAWREVVLWAGDLRFGVRDPVLSRDLGMFVARLPLLERLQELAFRLSGVALVMVGLAYTAVGSIRRGAHGIEVGAQARRHLAGLLALAALAVGAGGLLQPAAALAGGRPLPGLTAWRVLAVSSSAMLGVALGVAAISTAWAIRARGSFVAAGWIVFGMALFIQRTVLPSVVPPGPPLIDATGRRALDATAWTLGGVDQRPAEQADLRGPPLLWEVDALRAALGSDASRPVFLAPGTLPGPPAARPVWFAVQPRPDGQADLLAVAADSVTTVGGPLSYRQEDSTAYPGLLPWLTLGPGAIRPGALGVRIDTAQGVPLGGTIRRAVLAWALQAPDLLAPGLSAARADWRRTPSERLAGLVPWVEWGPPALVLVDGTPWWVSTGLVSYRRFPGGVPSAGRLGAEVAAVGAVRAADGLARAMLSPAAGPVARLLARFAGGGLMPAESLAAPLRSEAPYPPPLFEAQVAALERAHWNAGQSVPARGAAAPPLLDAQRRPVPVAAFEDSGGRSLSALLVGRLESGTPAPVLVRLPEAGLAGPLTLSARWRRFPVFEQVADSVEGAGGRLEPGQVRYQVRDGRPEAWQAWWGFAPGRRPALRWVSAARGERLGAGRSLEEAWANLEGTRAPAAPGASPGSRLDEVRRWFERAEAALRAGDWEGFGRALAAMRTLLDAARPDSSR